MCLMLLRMRCPDACRRIPSVYRCPTVENPGSNVLAITCAASSNLKTETNINAKKLITLNFKLLTLKN